MNYASADQLHASAVAVDGQGVLLRGPSGSGKSDLALRLIDGGAKLVADDRVDIVAEQKKLQLSPPGELAGLLEVRGLGIVRLAHETKVSLSLIVDLVKPEVVVRLPETLYASFMGVQVRLICLDPFQVSAVAKIHLALSVHDKDMLEPK